MGPRWWPPSSRHCRRDISLLTAVLVDPNVRGLLPGLTYIRE